jgi:ABC-2 type transport system permease protein
MKSGTFACCLFKLTWAEARLYLREPVSVFFTLVFPSMMLFIFGTIYLNQPAVGPQGAQAAIDRLIPDLSSTVIGIVGLMAVTITMATYRENGILRRLSTTPVSPLAVMGAQVLVVFCMTALGVLLLAAAGALFYQARAPGNLFSILAGFVLCCLSFFGIGFILAGVMPTARTAQVVALVLLYPMLILSGAAWPRELMPEAVRKISTFLPLTYVVNMLRAVWLGEAWGEHLLDIAVLVGMLLVGLVVSARTFRWE